MVMVEVFPFMRVVTDNILNPLLSGPPSCLCSKIEQCEITEDNELDVVPNITEVTLGYIFQFLYNHKSM